MQHSQTIPLMEHFYTLQGEGANSGRAAYFIRLGGCTVGCVWCDVKESWDASAHPLVAATEIARLAAHSGAPLAMVTGGEPLMYNLFQLCTELRKHHLQIALETSGAYELTGDFDWICLSPKKFKEPVESIYSLAHELKVVIYHPSDFKWAETHAAKVNDSCILYLQPEWSRRDVMNPMIVDFIKQNPRWRMSLQTHKYLEIP
jgi:organic radical activating enzyme